MNSFSENVAPASRCAGLLLARWTAAGGLADDSFLCSGEDSFPVGGRKGLQCFVVCAALVHLLCRQLSFSTFLGPDDRRHLAGSGHDLLCRLRSSLGCRLFGVITADIGAISCFQILSRSRVHSSDLKARERSDAIFRWCPQF